MISLFRVQPPQERGDLTLQHEDDIAAYEKMRAEKFPFKPKTIPAKHWAEERIESAREPEDADWTGPLALCLIEIIGSLASHQTKVSLALASETFYV